MDKSFEAKPFELFDKEWAILTAGPLDKHNSMTISWGGVGTLWGKPVVTVYVKPCRYTHAFMEENEYFVVSFFNEEYRKALGIIGSFSGKDTRKDDLARLSPYGYNGVTIYKEAETVFICKKIYQNDLDINSIPDEEKDQHYKEQAPHTMYIGEVVEIIKK